MTAIKAAFAVRSLAARASRLVPALALGLGLLVLSSLGASADPSVVPTLPPTDTFNSTFADVQTWATSMIAGPGKFVIYTSLSFIGFGLVYSWIKRSVKTH